MVGGIVLTCFALQLLHVSLMPTDARIVQNDINLPRSPLNNTSGASSDPPDNTPDENKQSGANGTGPYISVSNKDFLQDLRAKIVGMEKRITNTERSGSNLENIVSQDSNLFYFPKGLKNYVAKKYYQEYDYTFLGFGLRASQSTWSRQSSATTIHECVKTCFRIRGSDKHYDGIAFYHISAYNNRCFCTRYDKGHSDNNGYLHYRYVPVI